MKSVYYKCKVNFQNMPIPKKIAKNKIDLPEQIYDWHKNCIKTKT